MAHLFENLLTRRRNRSSNSSTEEYPGAKNPRGTSASSTDAQQDSEDDD